MRAIRDARSLSQEQQELLRRKAVEMVISGKKQVEVAELLAISRNSVGRWVKRFKSQGKKALAKRKRGKAPTPKLNKAQESCICRLIQDNHPEQLKLPFALWTREAVQALILKK
jgi:transposase